MSDEKLTWTRTLDVTLAELIEIACLMEATARKPGNVHPAAEFDDLTYADFVCAAKAISEPIAVLGTMGDEKRVGDDDDIEQKAASRGLTESAAAFNADEDTPHSGPLPAEPVRGGSGSIVGLGDAIYQAVKATREATGTNVNLGIVLLLAPLAAVPRQIPLQPGIATILQGTTPEDAESVYAAIRLAFPGGMGNVSSQDIRERPTVNLVDAMRLAVDRDRIAEQYCTDFHLVFEARQKLSVLLDQTGDWEAAVIALQVWMMSVWPDTLIARKCGWEIARESAARAAALLPVEPDQPLLNPAQLAEFDRWLRADGHRRNPGTTADLVAATLFAALRDGLIPIPSRSAICDRAKSILAESSETTI